MPVKHKKTALLHYINKSVIIKAIFRLPIFD